MTPIASSRRSRRTQAERVAESSQRLIDAAVALIGEQGWEKTTAAEIGLRAGYSRGIVNERFGSKDALLEAILRRDYERGFLWPPSAEGATGLDRVLARPDQLTWWATTDPVFLRAMFVLEFEAVSSAHTLQRRTELWLNELHRELVDSIKLGQRDGSIRIDVDPTDEAWAFISTGIGLAFRWTLMPDSVDLRAEIGRWRHRLIRQLAAAD